MIQKCLFTDALGRHSQSADVLTLEQEILAAHLSHFPASSPTSEVLCTPSRIPPTQGLGAGTRAARGASGQIQDTDAITGVEQH